MGRGKKRGGRGRGDGGRGDRRMEGGGGWRERRAGPGNSGPPPGGWEDETGRGNADFEEYYKQQNIVPEGEWDEFMATLRKPLPVTFRINGGGRFADYLRDRMQNDFFSHFADGDTMVEDDSIQPPRALPWYPNNYAWHLEFTRQQLRKTPLLNEIHAFLKKANDAGSISRQEAVSMVPPLFLDVQPSHVVLDMCAAPGSKTQQLLEALHSGDTFPSGFVVANDADYQRCNLLTHQTKRVCSPCLLVTNHSAELFPEVQSGLTAAAAAAAAVGVAEAGAAAAAGAGAAAGTEDGGAAGGSQATGAPLRFDRVLADVPCSGDGTMRKAPDIWRRWGVGAGNGLHIVQLRIALQGAKLLKVGGRMVYSTCTFNPIENEAVVAELLTLCQGAIELLDVSAELPALRRMPGLTSWKVRDRSRFYSSWDEAKDVCFKLDPTMFSTPAKAQLPLQRCMRFLPHHQDTGGFFVCVMRKVAELPAIEMPSVRERFPNRGVGKAGTEEKAEEAAEEDAATAADGDGADEEQGVQGDGEGEAGAKEEDGEGRMEVEDEGTTGAGGAEEGLPGAMEEAGAKGGQETEAGVVPEGKEETEAKEAEAGTSAAAAAPATDAAGPSSERRPLLEVARLAAQDALDAAERAVGALAAGDGAAASVAARDAAAAGKRAAAASNTLQRQAKSARNERGGARGGGAGSAGGRGAAGAAATAAAATDGGSADADAAPGPSGAAAAAAAAAPRLAPSWVRGGGGRNREAGKGGSGRHHAALDPIVPVEDPTLLQPLAEYYGLAADFPFTKQLIARSMETSRPKRLYFVASVIYDLLVRDEQELLKVMATGLKVFERQDLKDSQANCQYRLAQEGLPFLLPYVTRQRVQLSKQDFVTLLEHRVMMMPEGARQDKEEGDKQEAEKEGEADAPRKDTRPVITDARLIAQLADARPGCVVAELLPSDAEELGVATAGGGSGGGGGALTANAPLALSAWKGKASLAIMVDRNETAQMMDRMAAAMSKKA